MLSLISYPVSQEYEHIAPLNDITPPAPQPASVVVSCDGRGSAMVQVTALNKLLKSNEFFSLPHFIFVIGFEYAF